jgi:hypothetical protein
MCGIASERCGARVAGVRTINSVCRGPQHLLARILSIQNRSFFWSTAAALLTASLKS